MKLRKFRKVKLKLQKGSLPKQAPPNYPTFNIQEAYEILGNLRDTSAGLVALSLVAGYDPRIFMPDLH